MDRDAHIRWLRGELRKREQPCWCMNCGSARGELLFLGADPAKPDDSAPRTGERAA